MPVSLVPSLAVFGLLAGCGGPHAELRQPVCRPVSSDGQVRSYEFRSDIAVSGLEGEQLVFHVGLVDARSRPIRSVYGRYQDETGQVSARRTLMVLEPNKMFEPTMLDASVSLPAEELDLSDEDLPAYADFTVRRAGGELLARARVRLPIAKSESAPPVPEAVAAGPEAEAPPAEEATDGADETDEAAEPVEPPPPPVRAPRPATRRARAQAQSRIVKPASPAREPGEEDGWNRAPAEAGGTAGAEDEAAPIGPLTPPRGRRRAAAVPVEEAAPAGDAAAPQTFSPETRIRLAHLHATHMRLNPAWWWPIPEPAGVRPPAVVDDAPPPARKAVRRTSERAGTRYRKYVVRDGDTLKLISARVLRDASRWREILALNRGVIDDPDRPEVGVTLLLPPE